MQTGFHPVHWGVMGAIALLAACEANPPSASNPSPQVSASPQVSVAPALRPTPDTVAIAPASAPTPKNAPTQSTADPSFDTVIIPGERVGPITATTTRSDLSKLVDAAKLTDKQINVGEGETHPSTVVDLGAERSLTVVWTDDTQTKPASVRELGPAWKTPEGIGMGTSFNDLKTQLGPFQFYGFAWDYSGTIDLKGTKLSKYDSLLILRINPSTEAVQTYASDYQALTGDTLFSSDNPHLENLSPQVTDMIVLL